MIDDSDQDTVHHPEWKFLMYFTDSPHLKALESIF